MQLSAGVHDEVNELTVFGLGGAVLVESLGRGGGEEPAAHALGGDGGGEGFVEVGVAGDKEAAVGEFVENDFGEVGIGFVDESIENGVVEPAESGVGLDAVHINIPAFFGEGVGIAAGGLFVEIAAIAGAADDGEPPGHGIEGKWRGDIDVPDDARAAEVGVFEVALAGRETELLGGELADLQEGLEFGLERRRGLWIGDEIGDGLPMEENLRLAGDGLPVIRDSLAAGKEGGQQNAGQPAEAAAERGPARTERSGFQGSFN